MVHARSTLDWSQSNNIFCSLFKFIAVVATCLWLVSYNIFSALLFVLLVSQWELC